MNTTCGFRSGRGPVVLSDLARSGPLSSLFSSNYLPHRYCYLAQPSLVWTNAVADGLIAISYVSLFGCLFWLAGKVRHAAVLHPYLWIFIGFGLFILACGVTHGMEIVTIWRAGLSAGRCHSKSCARRYLFQRLCCLRKRHPLLPGTYCWLSIPSPGNGKIPKRKQRITRDRSKRSTGRS